MSLQISQISLPNLVDIYGEADVEEKRLKELKNRIKNQIKRKTNERNVYGQIFTLDFVPTNSSSFDKKSFIQEYSQKIYDKFINKSPSTRTSVKSSDDVVKPKDERILTITVNGFGAVSAGLVV